MNEPSVLDYLKAKLNPWKEVEFDFPEVAPDARDEISLKQEMVVEPATLSSDSAPEATVETAVQPASWTAAIPWKALIAVGLALIAQRALEPPNRAVIQAISLYIIAGLWLIWAVWKGEITIEPTSKSFQRMDLLTLRRSPALVGGLLLISAFLTFGGNRFNAINLILWLSGLVSFVYALWLPQLEKGAWIERLENFLKRPSWRVKVSWWSLLVLGAAALAVFFRLYQFNQVPAEMFSDHAEKLLDVQDVLDGETRIFFPRNTGREALQFYLTAAIAKYLGTGISFGSLKIGTVLAGLFTLPFIYLLGKEIGNQRVGLLAMTFAGISYWTNVISRVGLRFPFYPLFVAPVMYFLVRGLRTSNRNDFIWAGLALGIGLHGYSPIRVLPIVVVAGVLIYILHRQSQGIRQQAIWQLMVLAVVALVVFLPLGRFALENPTTFNYRAMTRVGDLEQPLPGPAWQIFLKNSANALIMFYWDNGDTWVHSIVDRPALDVVSAAFLFIGTILILTRYVRSKNWSDAFLLISIPLLMMPSILSLAFPNENPSLNRAGGALVPVFVVIGFGLESFFSAFWQKVNAAWSKRLAFGIAVLLLIWSAAQNFDLVFNQYYRQFLYSSWNTTELGHVIRSFDESVGSADNAWVVAYPHWVDTRLVGINAGFPIKDFGIWPENFGDTMANSGAKLFLIKPEDTDAIAALSGYYPAGTLSRYTSRVETKDFMMFFVPPDPSTSGP